MQKQAGSGAQACTCAVCGDEQGVAEESSDIRSCRSEPLLFVLDLVVWFEAADQ